MPVPFASGRIAQTIGVPFKGDRDQPHSPTVWAVRDTAMINATASRGPGRPATMADLAKIAGVSITTISHVLNETRFVSEDVRRRVLDAVAKTNYTPNFLARSIKTSTTNMIGLAAPALTKVALADLVRPIETEARARGLGVLFTDTEDDPLAEMAAIEALHARRVDGIIIAPSAPDSPAVEYLRDHRIPTVVVDRFTSGGFDQIGTENTRATQQLTQHLIDAGNHRRIALILSMPDFSTSIERFKGYRQALLASGLEVDTDLVGSGRDEAGRVLAAMEGFFSLSHPPTAIVSGNSSTTVGIMRAAGTLGLDVPRDLALVGFDDFEWADVFHPRLTVARQQMGKIGSRAVRLLQSRMADPDAPVTTRRIPTEFIHRDSCGCTLSPSQP